MHDGVDQAVFKRELCGLKLFRQLLTNGVLDNAAPGEPDKGLWLRNDHVPLHGERRGNAACGRVGYDGEVRQTRLRVTLYGA